MNRKVIIALAIILPLAGIGMLVAWAGSARQAAFEGAELAPVVQATKEIPAGTATKDLSEYAKVVELPKATIPKGAPESLDEVKDGAIRYDLAVGEFLTDSKVFSEKDGLDGAPAEYEEVTVSLDSERGSNQFVKVGDKVAMYASFSSPEQRTVRVLGTVLVSRIDGDTKTGKGASATEEAPGDVLVTFAVSSDDAKKIIYSSEFGEVWLSLTNPTSSDEAAADVETPAEEDVTAGDIAEGEAGQ